MKETAGFRTESRYNNIMFGLVGLVVEELGGKSWEDLLEEHILKPLGIKGFAHFHGQAPPGHHFSSQYTFTSRGRRLKVARNTFR